MWTCWDFFYDFSQQVSSFVRSTAVCFATFRRDLLFQLHNPYHTTSTVTNLQAAAQLEVACPIFCVLHDEHLYLSIELSVHFRLACSQLLLLALSAIPLPYF